MSYEQAPGIFPEVPKDGKKRIFVERRPTTNEFDVQIPKFKRKGYEEDKKYSTDAAVCLAIDEELYLKRQKEREEKTTGELLPKGAVDIGGGFTASAEALAPARGESFFDDKDSD